ncbi:MAG: histidinol dehydrogenase [Acidobacteria bacterium]|nr:histidinol dehydrogenase [Acidobacteriota bacterium]
MATVRILDGADHRAIEQLFERPTRRRAAIGDQVARIVADVRRRGDRAVRAYARQLDGLAAALEIGRDEIEAGARSTPATTRRALREAASNIRKVARAQRLRPSSVCVVPGIVVEQRVTPLRRVGCYVPGGRFPLPSSLLMTAIPARVAGVDEVIAVCPRPEPVVLAAAIEAGVDRMFRIGGAHAIAALAYGTDTIPRVDKIVGPGNSYVAEAKALVARECAIDFYAGPSEIVIVSNAAPATWIAADMLAQAEHDPEARAIFITTRRALARSVLRAIERRMPASGPARESLARRGAIIVARTREEVISIADRLTPEHLVCDDDEVASRVRAGTAFVGAWSAQAAGDYATGSNHVLPTAGAARFRGGLSAADFVRVSSVQCVTRAGLRRIGKAVITLAEAEGLTAHADSIRERLR